MTTMIEMVKVPYGAECFSGFRHTKDGHVIGSYTADKPVDVSGGDVLYVEIRDEDKRTGRCRVVMVNKAAGYQSSELASSKCRSRGKKQSPLTTAERAAIALQARVESEDCIERELKVAEVKQSVRVLFSASGLSPREERIVRLRLLHDLELKAVGDQFGVTPSCIRQIEVRALKKMKRAATALARQGAI